MCKGRLDRGSNFQGNFSLALADSSFRGGERNAVVVFLSTGLASTGSSTKLGVAGGGGGAEGSIDPIGSTPSRSHGSGSGNGFLTYACEPLVSNGALRPGSLESGGYTPRGKSGLTPRGK